MEYDVGRTNLPRGDERFTERLDSIARAIRAERSLPDDYHVRVGSAPWPVTLGLPGQRDEVRAYASRIDAAWKLFWDLDYTRWLADKAAGKDGGKLVLLSLVGPTPPGMPDFNDPIVMGEVVGGTPAERQLIGKVNGDRGAFVIYREKIAKFDPVVGPSPSAAWQELILHELALKDDRLLFTKVTGRKLESRDPGDLERPGGIEQPTSPVPGLLYGALGVAALFGVGYLVSSAAHLRGG